MASVVRDRQLDEETDGLVQDFRHGLFSSNTSPALKAFKQLVCYLESCYIHDSGLLPDPESRVKRKILSFLLSLRVNHLGQIGIQGPADECDYSPFVICGSSDSSLRSGSLTSSSSPPLTPSLLLGCSLLKLTELNLTEMVRVLLLVLEKEKDWQVLRLVLMGLKTMISQNPTLITLTKSCSSRNQMRGSSGRSIAGDIVTAAAQLIHGKGRSPDQLLNTECPKFTKSEFDRFVYPLLESLIVYGKELDSNHQTELLKAIQTGLQNRSYNRHTMQALTSCLMEMQDPKVVKYLPELLLTISKISATKALAVPKMSFLSTLVHFPQMYSSFTADQYMSIFAIAIPYTNYSEFDEFTIALAHRVIAMWFLNCKLEARMQFASYIRKNLVRNLHSIASGEEDMRARSHSVGTSMKRSPTYVRVPQTPTSLHQQHIYPHHVPLPASPGHTLSPAPHSASSNTIFFSEASLPVTGSRSLLSSCSSIAARETLHRELFEACMDLLSRYTHGMCSSVPRKNPLADFIIDRETAMTWFVGQSLITIAVSHCGAKAVEKGLCRKCQEVCNSVRATKESATTASVSSDVESDNAFTCSTDSNSKDTDAKTGTRFSDSQRRRHQSAIDSRRVTTKLKSRAFDDIHLETISSVPTPSHPASSASNSQNENCSCWCQGWAEITERRPTGKTSFMMRIENSLNLPCYASPAACDSGSYPPLVRIYDPRLLTHSAPRHPNSETTQQKSHTTSTNPDTGLTVDRDSGILSSCSSVRRTSSSPEIEHNRMNQFEDVEVEEAKEVRDDDQVPSQSPTKGLARTVSLGKAEMAQRPASSSPSIGNPVTRASSFSSKAKMMSPNRVTEDESVSSIAKTPSDATIAPSSGTTSGWTRSANKKSLTISLENTSNAVHMNGSSGTASSVSLSLSPMKSKPSPKTPDEQVNLMSQSDSVATGSGVKEGAGHTESPSSLRERSHTFSTNTMNKKPASGHAVTGHQYHNRHPMLQRQSVHPDTHTKSTGLSPSFFFLRLYYSPSFNQMSHESECPILLPSGSDTFARSVRLLDVLTPFETHKIGVLYVAPDQKTRNEILQNEHGSMRYQQMLERIANLVRLKDVDQEMCFIGGLDNVHDMDGKFVYCWADHLTQVVFHVATLMPTKDRDPTCNDKFRHIGNDFVWIVYNESGSPFCRTTLFNEKLPFLKVCIVITPLDCGVNNVLVQADQEMDRITGLPESFMISDQNLSLYVRQIAIHANLAYRQQYETAAKRGTSDCMPFVSNWVERLRHMKRLRTKLLESGSPATSSTEFESISASGHRPRSMTTATRDSMTQHASSDGHDSEYPDYDFTAFTG